MNDEPARALRYPQPHEEDDEAQSGADQERRAPAQVVAQHVGVEQHDRRCCSERGANPEAAVDHEIGPTAHARGHQLLDCGVDGGVLAADAGTRQKAEEGEARQVPREGGGGGSAHVDRECYEEQLLAAQAVREPAKEHRAQHGAGEIGAGGEADVGAGEVHDRALSQRAGDRAGQRHLQPVEDPGDTKRNDDERVKVSPGKTIEPRRQVRLDDGPRRVGRPGAHYAWSPMRFLRMTAVVASKATSRTSIPATRPSSLHTSAASRQASCNGYP